jgi:hypothetical protein
MNIKTIITAAGLALATSGCGAAAHQQVSRGSELQCARVTDPVASQSLLSNAVRAEPIHHQRVYAGGPQADHVVGAKLYVPAEAGQSEAYLERVMSCRLESGQAGVQPNDPLGVEGVRHVAVRAAGSSFEVSIVGSDAQSGEAIWQRARALAGQVGVEQVASIGVTSDRS